MPRVNTGASATARPRLDAWLVANGLAASRERAQALVMAGRVRVDGRPATKPGTALRASARVELLPGPEHVGRGAVKLEGALGEFALDVRGRVAVDVGASTGGFTETLLRHGAARVFAVDVGRGQLHESLRSDPRVVPRERVNARALSTHDVPEPCGLATLDVSFISATRILPALRAVLAPGADVLVLVKPQFEVGRAQVGRGGLVKDPALHVQAMRHVAECAVRACGFALLGCCASPIAGSEGNREFFLHLRLDADGLPEGAWSEAFERALADGEAGKAAPPPSVTSAPEPSRGAPVEPAVTVPEARWPGARAVGILARADLVEASGLLRELTSFLRARGLRVCLEERTARLADGGLAPGSEAVPDRELAAQVDMVIVLGGDGTLLAASRLLEPAVPVLAVNFGSLGFLTEVALNELFPTLERALAGECRLEERRLLRAQVARAGRAPACDDVLNDVVVTNAASSRLLDLDVAVDGRFVSSFRADGLIVSSPTGSTAYNLSAGGPILHPLLPALVVTPICPHMLSHRPLVVLDHSTVEVRVRPARDLDAHVAFDGQRGLDLAPGETLTVTRSPRVLRLIKTPARDYFEVLRTKLKWGEATARRP